MEGGGRREDRGERDGDLNECTSECIGETRRVNLASRRIVEMHACRRSSGRTLVGKRSRSELGGNDFNERELAWRCASEPRGFADAPRSRTFSRGRREGKRQSDLSESLRTLGILDTYCCKKWINSRSVRVWKLFGQTSAP